MDAHGFVKLDISFATVLPEVMNARDNACYRKQRRSETRCNLQSVYSLISLVSNKGISGCQRAYRYY